MWYLITVHNYFWKSNALSPKNAGRKLILTLHSHSKLQIRRLQPSHWGHSVGKQLQADKDTYRQKLSLLTTPP